MDNINTKRLRELSSWIILFVSIGLAFVSSGFERILYLSVAGLALIQRKDDLHIHDLLRSTKDEIAVLREMVAREIESLVGRVTHVEGEIKRISSSLESVSGKPEIVVPPVPPANGMWKTAPLMVICLVALNYLVFVGLNSEIESLKLELRQSNARLESASRFASTNGPHGIFERRVSVRDSGLSNREISAIINPATAYACVADEKAPTTAAVVLNQAPGTGTFSRIRRRPVAESLASNSALSGSVQATERVS